jgi:tetratricopeptide (TPR) repeat protein
MSDPDHSRTRRLVALCLLLAVAVLMVYSQVGRFEFTNYDDPDYAANNRFVQMGLTWESVQWAFHNPFAWHPLTWLSHIIDGQIFGVNPGAHHWVNAGFHVANTLLLFLALLRLTGAEGRSAFVAALFALHPLHVESVAWVAERKDLLSGFFWMLTLLAYARHAERPGPWRYALVLLCFTLGLMAKPMVVTLPFVLLLLDYWPLGRLRPATVSAEPGSTQGAPSAVPSRPWSIAPSTSWTRLVLEKLPLLALSAAASAVTVLYLRSWGKLDMEIYLFTTRLANAFVSYARYLGKTVLPEDLSVIYPHPGAWPWWAVAGACLLLGLVTMVAVIGARRMPYLFVGWLWFVGTLVPVLGLIQMNPQAMADRYTYIPLIGLFVAVAWGGTELAARLSCPKPVLAGTGLCLLLGCAMVTWRQLQHWENSTTLFSHAVAVTQDNPRAQYNLGQSLSMLSQSLLAQGRAADAQALLQRSMEHYEEALRVMPNYPEAHNNLGLTLVTLGRIREATNHYAEALRLNPKNDADHYNYANALGTLGQYAAAAGHFESALQLDPENPLTHFGLAHVLELQGRPVEALAHYREAVRMHPNYVEGHFGLGLLLTSQGHLDEAVKQLSAAARLAPSWPDTHARLGVALAAAGRTREALLQYREALRLKPDQPVVLNNLAWLLATHPQSEFRSGREAVELAERACTATSRKQPIFIGTLAAAYAEAGQFDKAVEAAQQARALAEAQGQKEIATRNQQLLELYQRGKAFHEAP